MDIPVDGMHCSSCSLLVEKSLGKLEEVDSINVDLNTNKAHMVLNDKISPDVIDKTVESVGFTVPKEEVVIQIDGMHCASCVNNVERFLPRVDGVVEANAIGICLISRRFKRPLKCWDLNILALMVNLM